MKIFLFLGDGVSFRNFAYTNLNTFVNKANDTLVLWNSTPFSIPDNYSELKAPKARIDSLTSLFKRAKTEIEISLFTKESNDSRYKFYLFPKSYKNLKSFVKSTFVNILILLFSSRKGLNYIRKKIYSFESRSDYFKNCIQQLEESKPDIVFFTSQRDVKSIAPLLAAKKLGIKTAVFIYSWDNLPKGTLLVEADYFFVWSNHMKKELLNYYPHLNSNHIVVTGTPQFEFHFDKDLLIERKEFYDRYHLDIEKEYICFSGDDETTSPNDPLYLKDLASIVRKINKSKPLGIIFRRCPVDFSGRYDKVLEEFSDVIVPINPVWEKINDAWNSILPKIEDNSLLYNTIYHSSCVINIGSSMVFDACLQNRPCIYLNYDVDNPINESWSTKKIYQFIHFDSKPTSEVVEWMNAKEELEEKLLKTINHPQDKIEHAKKWLDVVVNNPRKASVQILKAIKSL